MMASIATLVAFSWTWSLVYAGAAGKAVWSERKRRRDAAIGDARTLDERIHRRDAPGTLGGKGPVVDEPQADEDGPHSGPRLVATRATHAMNVVLLRPCCGLEPGLASRLSHGGGANTVLFAVATAEDGAMPAAFTAAFELTSKGTAARVLVTRARGPNRKADQLARALADMPLDANSVVVVADADVDLEHVDVRRFARPLVASGRGRASEARPAAAVWAPPVEVGRVGTIGDAVSRAVLDASLHSFPLLAGIDPDVFVGKLFAIRRDALDRAGGFDDLRAYLGEDLELGRRLRDRGERVTVSSELAHSVATGRTLTRIVERYTRWLLVVRAQRPHLLVSYPVLMAAGPLAGAFVVAGIRWQSTALLAAGLSGLATRFVVACVARRAAGRSFAPVRAFIQAVVADLILLASLARALASRQVLWHDVPLRLGPNGRLSATDERTRDLPAFAVGWEAALNQARNEARANLEAYLEGRTVGTASEPPAPSGIRPRGGGP